MRGEVRLGDVKLSGVKRGEVKWDEVKLVNSRTRSQCDGELNRKEVWKKTTSLTEQ